MKYSMILYNEQARSEESWDWQTFQLIVQKQKRAGGAQTSWKMQIPQTQSSSSTAAWRITFSHYPKGWQNVQTGTSQFKQLQTNRKDVWNEDKFACFTAKLLGKWHEHDLFRVFAGSPNSVLCLRDRHIISVNQWKNGRRPKTHLIQLFHWNFQVLSTNQTTFVL